MNNEKYSKSNLISLILHVLVIWAAFSLKSAHIITPARSDGIEVSLVSSTNLPQPQATQPVANSIPETIKTIENNADINIKQMDKPREVQSEPKPIAPHPKKIQISPQKQDTKRLIENKKPDANITNSLLSQLGAPENSGKTRARATGGIQSGTSDSNVMINNYADQVISAVRPYVDVPDGIADSANAVVKIVLLPNMKVYKVQLQRSSGNPSYDASIQEAIKRVAVFPPLPDGAKFIDFRVLYVTFKPI